MRLLISALGLLLALTLPAYAQEKAEAEWKRLAERAAQASGNVDQVRQELLVFRQTHPGTPQALAAAGWLRDLPSPLDKFDAKNINPLEKFPWQPKELVAVLGEHRGRQGGPVTSVVYSRNGKMLASGTYNGFVRIWDPATMRLQHRLVQGGGNYSLAFSKDNAILAGGAGNGTVTLWDVSVEPPNQKELFKVASSAIHSLAIAPNYKTLAVGSGDPRVTLFDLTESPPRETASGDTHTAIIKAIAFAPDGKTLATGSMDKTLRLWNILKDNKLKEKAMVEAHPGGVLALAFHPTDEKVLITGGADGLVRVWNVGGPKPVSKYQFKSGGGGVHALAFSQSGKTLASAHADGTCRTWTFGAAAATEKAVLEGHGGIASAVTFSPDGSTVVTGSHDWTVRQWPAVSGPKPRNKTILAGHLSHVYDLSFAPDGQSLASTSADRSLRIWDMAAAEAKERVPNIKPDAPQLGIAFAPDGKSIVAFGSGTTFRSYDAASRKPLQTFQGHTGAITALAFAPDSNVMATSSADKSVRLWNPKTGKGVGIFNDFEAPVYAVDFSSDSQNLLTANGAPLLDKKALQVIKDGIPIYQDSTVRVYEVMKKKEVFRWKDERMLPRVVAFAPDGKQFIVGASDILLRSWSWPEPQPNDPAVLYKNINATFHMAFSPDGRTLALFADGAFALLDRATGKRLRYWPLQENYGNIAFAPDSRHVAISMGTGVIYLLRLDEPGKK